MALASLCTYEECAAFEKGVPELATGTQSPSDHVEAGERKITSAHRAIELKLSTWIQERLDRLNYTNTDYVATGVLATPAAIIPKLHADSVAYMNQYAMTCWVYEMLKEGQTTKRFKHAEATQQITDAMLIWGGSDGEGGLKSAEWDKIQRLIFFDLNGDGKRDRLENVFRETIASVPYYV